MRKKFERHLRASAMRPFKNGHLFLENVGEHLVLLATGEKISPWDLLDPFPPANYYDYGYMELVTTKDDPHWKDLKTGDKNL